MFITYNISYTLGQKMFNKMPISRFLDLDCHDIGTCELHAKVKGLQLFQHM